MIQANKFSPNLEHELVLASVSLDRSKDKRIYEILESKLDWTLILHIAVQQGIFPLFCQHIMVLGEKQIPQEEFIRWKELYQINRQNNLHMTWKLIKFVELLFNNGIECIVFKGPVLAIQAYGALSLRNYMDLDILIHQIDFPKAYDLLVQAGYTPAFTLNNRQKKFEIRTYNHFQFNRQGDVFEVHWLITQQEFIYRLLTEQMWREVRSINIFDKEIYSLSPENTILFICLHGAKHGWKQLKWILDLAYLCQSFPENAWIRLIEHAKQVGLYRQVCLGLLLTVDLVDAKLPGKVLDLINKDHHAQVLVTQVKAGLFKEPSKPSIFGDFLFYLRTRERWRDRLNNLLDLIFLPKQRDWITFSLPENLFFLYYFFRPLRLLYKLGKAVISALF